MIKDIFVVARLITDIRNIRLLLDVHKEFSKDKNYSLVNLLKSLWLVSKDEKIIRFDDKYIISSFLPPIPSKAFFQLFNATPMKNTRFHEHVNAIRTAPISTFISVTDRCKYNCWHCSKANREQSKDMPLKTIKKIISDLQDMGTAIIGITGGEPSLRKDLAKIISSIDERSVSFLFTTGQDLSFEKAKELKKSGLFAVGISLDHYDEKAYDKLRGYKGAYRIALDAIENCKKAGIYTMIQTVATKKMLGSGDLWKMIDLAKELGVNEIRILENMPTGRLIDIPSSMILSSSERNDLIKIQKKANWSGKYPKVTTFAKTESFDQFGCGAGTQHSYIDSKGNLYPCDFVPLSFGNIDDKPIKDLWNEMNNEIRVPRDICFILENYKKIGKVYKEKLPLDKKESLKMCKDCRKMKNFPGFYRTLRGKA